ncbi:MAG: AAA family ATPase [Bacteroidales bacterium]|nr:AAA family ATPase [Bacteroidales bacterium]
MEPTCGQKELFSKLGQFLTGNADERFLMMVSGYAGTGKTSAIAACISVLKTLGMKYVLLAPTGRSAKVLAGFTGEKASTIHRHIYRMKSQSDPMGAFSLNFNKAKDTVYFVDEVSLISTGDGSDSIFGSGNLLDDLLEFVRQSSSNRLVLIGDPAQLPPVGLDVSPALDLDYMKRYCPKIDTVILRDVVRQAEGSGILVNATSLRQQITDGDIDPPFFDVSSFTDIAAVTGATLIEDLQDAVSRYGNEEVVVLCRSNQRANRYNLGIRSQVLFLEEKLCRGDRLMVVKNCYKFDGGDENFDFIANGDMANLVSISNYQERYGLHFADATLAFPDYNDCEVDAKVILDTLDSKTAALDRDAQTALFEGVLADYEGITPKKKRFQCVREDPYYNALQIKYSSAITGHKSQGGQWRCVFIDNILWKDEITIDDKKWLYTALTRAQEMVYLVNFDKKYLK